MANTTDVKDSDHFEASSNTIDEQENPSAKDLRDRETPKIESARDQSQGVTTRTSSPSNLGTDIIEETKSVRYCDPREPMEPLDWDSLEERYLSAMNECELEERKINQEFHDWVKVFETWASVTCVHENDRAYKRLKTRMSFVQTAEGHLEEKRRHYDDVVKAFESALALLGSTT